MSEQPIWWRQGLMTVTCMICREPIGSYPVTAAAPALCRDCSGRTLPVNPYWLRTARDPATRAGMGER